MKTRAELIINNVPEYALEHRFWVVTLDDGNKDQAWFYGAWDTDEEVSDVLNQFKDKFIVHNPEWKEGENNG